jgi:ribosomal protein L11 methyltransferase
MPTDRWARMDLTAPTGLARELAAWSMAQGASGVQEDHPPGMAPPPRQPWDRGPRPPRPSKVVVRSWWPLDGFDVLLARFEADLNARMPGVVLSWREEDPSDWDSWRAHFRRLEIAPGLAVAPPWLAQEGDLIIEPGLAFGSGDHPTTRFCLEAIARWVEPGDRCLDVGSGSGVLALAAVQRGGVALGVDTDPMAVRTAAENASRNGLEAEFSSTPLRGFDAAFDVVVANLYAEVLVALSADLARLTGRRLILAGILSDRSESVRDAMRAQGLRLDRDEVTPDWVGMEWVR